ncbi:hypothetical protein RCL1_000234 [Eukaryota sp. TZLM3-RCL]
MIRSVAAPNSVKVYHVTAGKAVPQFSRESKTSSLRKDESYRRRVDLLQEFSFPIASQCIRLCNDGEHIIASGTYPPQIRTWDLNQMSLKFQRNVEHEILTFEVLSDDWKKLAILRDDRFVELHSQGGYHFKTRVPKAGRNLTYHKHSCDLLIVGSSSEIFRLNLEEGRFMNPITTTSDALNVVKICPSHQLIVAGSECGMLHPHDPRDYSPLNSLLVSANIGISSMAFHSDGIHLAVGNEAGEVFLYDIRSPNYLFKNDLKYDLPVHSLGFHQDKVVASDANVVKIWEKNGESFTAWEHPCGSTSMAFDERNGLFLFGAEQERCLAYFVPTLAPAPRWCSYLDSLTEELEESGEQTHYDDYKFVTSEELKQLGLSNLIGSSSVRAYMHGYYVDVGVYSKAKAVFNYDNELDSAALLEKIEKEKKQKLMVSTTKSQEIDSRFANVLNDDDFKIDSSVEKKGKSKVGKSSLTPISQSKSNRTLYSVAQSSVLSTSNTEELTIPLKDRLKKRS